MTSLIGGALSVVICITTVLAAPAAARRHRHHRRHHATCGPGTFLQDGQCLLLPGGPVGSSNVVVSPNPIVMTLGGHVAGSITFNGLLPLDHLGTNTVSVPDDCGDDECGPPPPPVAGIPCGPHAVLSVSPIPLQVDASGHATASVHDVTIPPGPGGCLPGTYPLVFFDETEGGVPLTQTFTVFVTLVF